MLAINFTGDVALVDTMNSLPIFIGEEDISGRLWELAGAFDGSTLTVTIASSVQTAWGEADAIVLSVTHDILEKPMLREILVIPSGEFYLVMHNAQFYLKKEFRQQGIGRACLAVEAAAAHDLEFTKIVANAANRPDVGWIVWPKLGYDAVIEPDVMKKMHDELVAAGLSTATGSLRISDLYDSNNYQLWEKHGAGCIMEFDVSALDSWSMRQLGTVINKEDLL